MRTFRVAVMSGDTAKGSPPSTPYGSAGSPLPAPIKPSSGPSASRGRTGRDIDSRKHGSNTSAPDTCGSGQSSACTVGTWASAGLYQPETILQWHYDLSCNVITSSV